jgi:hypothetical protein
MRKLLCAVALCLAVGCGPRLSGTYTGMVTTTGVCSDGTGPQPQTSAVAWTFSQQGSSYEVSGSGYCLPAALVGEGADTLNFQEQACQPQNLAAASATARLIGGHVSILSETALTVELDLGLDVVTNTGTSGTCSEQTTGSLSE